MFFEFFAITFGFPTFLFGFVWLATYPTDPTVSDRMYLLAKVSLITTCTCVIIHFIDLIPSDIVYKKYKVLDRIDKQYKTTDGWYLCQHLKSVGDDITVITKMKCISGRKYIETK